MQVFVSSTPLQIPYLQGGIGLECERLGRYIRRTYSEEVVSDAALQLFWRSFHFFAHCPFPKDPQDGIDFDAFQCAVCLTALQYDKTLGEVSKYCIEWRKESEYRRSTTFRRIIESIVFPGTLIPDAEKKHRLIPSTSYKATFILWNIVDCLAGLVSTSC